MTNIHHSIVKSAAAKGVILTVEDDAIQALFAATNLRVKQSIESDDDQTYLNDLARDAFRDVLEMRDYNADEVNEPVRILQDLDDGDFVAYVKQPGTGEYTYEIARDPVLEDLRLSVQDWRDGEAQDDYQERENELDDTTEADEEDRGSVVPAKYKAIYAEAGHPTHCGDWLAETLNRFCRVVDGETGKETTDIDTLETIANANDVAPERYGKLGVQTNGWQGRFRMTVRNMLTPRVAGKGFIFIPSDVTGKEEGDLELKAPREWCAAHAPKVKAKPAKTDAEKAKKPEGKANAKTKAKKDAVIEQGLKAASDAIKASKAKSPQ